MPRNKSFDDAKGLDNGMLLAFLICKQILAYDMAKVEDDSTSKQRKDGILLKLERHDWGIGLARWSNSKSLLRVSNCIVENRLAGCQRHRGNAQSSTKKSISNFEESCAWLLDI